MRVHLAFVKAWELGLGRKLISSPFSVHLQLVTLCTCRIHGTILLSDAMRLSSRYVVGADRAAGGHWSGGCAYILPIGHT